MLTPTLQMMTYGIVNLYNLSKQSPANTLGEFLIPLLSDSYMVDILHLDLPMYPSAYMGVIALFLIGTAMGISTWFYAKQKNDGQVQMIFFLSISALGRITYYVNRPSYHNLDCVSLSAVILLAYLGQRGMTFVKERKRGTRDLPSLRWMDIPDRRSVVHA